jgi:hypothetical protein
MGKRPDICFLSGLKIPSKEYSVEHLVAKFWLPENLYSLPENKKPSIKIINHIKNIKMPCEWYDTRYELCYHALQNWNLKNKDKGIIIRALARFATEKEPLNPCQHCILSSKAKEYCYARRDLEKYRIRWLYGIQQR